MQDLFSKSVLRVWKRGESVFLQDDPSQQQELRRRDLYLQREDVAKCKTTAKQRILWLQTPEQRQNDIMESRRKGEKLYFLSHCGTREGRAAKLILNPIRWAEAAGTFLLGLGWQELSWVRGRSRNLLIQTLFLPWLNFLWNISTSWMFSFFQNIWCFWVFQ